MEKNRDSLESKIDNVEAELSAYARELGLGFDVGIDAEAKLQLLIMLSLRRSETEKILDEFRNGFKIWLGAQALLQAPSDTPSPAKN